MVPSNSCDFASRICAVAKSVAFLFGAVYFAIVIHHTSMDPVVNREFESKDACPPQKNNFSYFSSRAPGSASTYLSIRCIQYYIIYHAVIYL